MQTPRRERATLPHILYGVVVVEILPGDFVGFRARRDRRLFRVKSLDGDVAVIYCPCCGIVGRSMLKDLRRLHPLEAQHRLDGADAPDVPLVDAGMLGGLDRGDGGGAGAGSAEEDRLPPQPPTGGGREDGDGEPSVAPRPHRGGRPVKRRRRDGRKKK